MPGARACSGLRQTAVGGRVRGSCAACMRALECVGAQVPYMEDSNTGVASFESKAIIDYLEETYAVK
jgi:hypothetical protein